VAEPLYFMVEEGIETDPVYGVLRNALKQIAKINHIVG
jgi:hypothetical protein